MTNLDISIKYANDVISGEVPACLYVKQAAQRFLNDLNGDIYYYDNEQVDKVVAFVNALYLTEQVKPKHFLLEPWQTFIVANIYGICRIDNQLRKYRSAYIELARKNGKSQLVTALALYHTIFDTDAQVVVSANSREQARNVDFKKLKQFATQLDPKQKHLVHYYNSIKFNSNELIVTASDPKRLDGLNASFCLIDELHEAPDNKMYNVMKSSQGAREEPLLMTITTAGFDTESFCYLLRTYCTEILSGEKTDDSQFAIIYTIDPEDQIEDKDIWLKANPNLNISVYQNFLESEVNKAVNNESERSGVAVKNFNCWMKNNSTETWIPESYISASMDNIQFDNDIFKGMDCVVGVDLASVSDITAVSYLFIKEDKFYFLNDYYIPELSVSTNINREMYKEAAQFKHITITEGNVIDYDYILNDIKIKNELHNVTAIYYDRYNSTQFAIAATEAGFYMQQFSQLAGSLNKPLKEFERLIKSDKVVIQKNPITKWMINNVVLKINHMGNYSIDKSSKNKKIDGVAAMMDALGGLLSSPNYSLMFGNKTIKILYLLKSKMGIFSKRKVNVDTEKRSFDEWTNPVLGTLNISSATTYIASKAMKLSTVYRCVNLISDSIASMPLIPYTYMDKAGNITNWKYINYNDNYYNLLNIQPNGLMSANTFKKMLIVNMLMKGNAYVQIDRDKTGIINSLILMNSDFVEVMIKNGELIYWDKINNKYYDKTQIIHLLNYSANGIFGVSTLTHAATTLGISYNSEEHTSNFFKGGASLAGILRPIAGVNINTAKATAAKESFINALNSDLNGTSNAIVVLDSGLEYQPITISPKDAQLLESRQFNVIDVCRFFGVPPTMAFSETGKFSTAEQQQVDYLNNTLTPLIEKIENEFFRKLYLPSEWMTSDLKFDTENLMRTDASTRATYYSTLFQVGGYTVNEIREKLNAGFPVAGGNRAFIQVNVQPTDALIAEQNNVSDPNNQLNNQVK